MHPDGTPLRATAILRGGGGCVVDCAAVLDFGHLVGGEIQEQAGLEGGLEGNEP